MTAKLVFLGKLADLAGAGEREVTAGPLTDVLAAMPVDLAMALSHERVRCALNGQLVSRETTVVLADGDEFAFLPPVSGG